MKRETKREVITPERAKELLANMIPNRKIRWDYVHRLAKDVVDGTFVDGTNCIGINEDGLTCDGQHRLLAIIEADKAVELDVKYGIPADAVTDRGNMRSIPDSLYMRGIISKELATTKATAMTNAYLLAKYGERTFRDMTEAFRGEFMRNNESDIILACNISARGGTSTGSVIARKAGVQAALFAAIQAGVDEGTLDNFMRIVNTGFQEAKEDSAAVVLRNYILSTTINGTSATQKLIKVAESAIYDFTHRIPRTKMYNPSNLQHKYISSFAAEPRCASGKSIRKTATA